ncbi:hypothetical protein [Methylacidimicrobium tartarophylax]|uniref:Uncharacterized protein n=1 Tax=Methylacidimicrobium tartarophylax TaxID=1041768 RepID=A0A5E6MDS3_9BACT|nr:hypothetical protein [Methylacidimicrobium tartarophylax]VVM07122.1 hypothetical protein MAMT_01586 [Methylacidimicrobium tartarophylax]
MGANTIRDYYAHDSVRRRIAEYCGGIPEEPQAFSCTYLVGYGTAMGQGVSPEPHASVEKKHFAELLNAGADILRSIWDQAAVLGILDIEYVNWDYPAEVFFQPVEVFSRIEPLYRTILRCFGTYGIEPLTILTGQGYHFVFQIPKDSAAFCLLAACGAASPQRLECGNRFGARFERTVSPLEATAYETLGRLFEFLVHRILQEYGEAGSSMGMPPLPAVPTEVAVGRIGPSGRREAISLDLSLYGDPLPRRATRCPFSVYQKHRCLWQKYGERAAKEFPIPVLLPRSPSSCLKELLEIRVDWDRATRMADGSSVAIPDASHSVLGWLHDYESSSLARIHREMGKSRPDGHDNPSDLPPCLLHCLLEPNPHLLKPTNLQALTRALLARDWMPATIADLVCARYREDHGWGDLWQKYEPATRAEFYVRLFSGLVLTGIDQEIDLNCISHQEKGYCWQPFCGFNLANYRIMESNGNRNLDRGLLF